MFRFVTRLDMNFRHCLFGFRFALSPQFFGYLNFVFFIKSDNLFVPTHAQKDSSDGTFFGFCFDRDTGSLRIYEWKHGSFREKLVSIFWRSFYSPLEEVFFIFLFGICLLLFFDEEIDLFKYISGSSLFIQGSTPIFSISDHG